MAVRRADVESVRTGRMEERRPGLCSGVGSRPGRARCYVRRLAALLGSAKQGERTSFAAKRSPCFLGASTCRGAVGVPPELFVPWAGLTRPVDNPVEAGDNRSGLTLGRFSETIPGEGVRPAWGLAG